MTLSLIATGIVVGILVGIISSVLGLGGGIILVPTLNLVFNLPQSEAVATSLATIALITLFNTIRFAWRDEIDWTIVFFILLFSALSSMTGGFLVTILNEHLLLIIFILFLFYVLVQMLFTAHVKLASKEKKSPLFWAAVIGLSSGIISGTTGVGGGVIITPLLFRSKITKISKVVPITNAIMFLNAFFALIPLAFGQSSPHYWLRVGLIHFDRAILIFMGAIPAALIGTKYQGKIPVKLKKIVIASILIIILVRLVLRLVHS